MGQNVNTMTGQERAEYTLERTNPGVFQIYEDLKNSGLKIQPSSSQVKIVNAVVQVLDHCGIEIAGLSWTRIEASVLHFLAIPKYRQEDGRANRLDSSRTLELINRFKADTEKAKADFEQSLDSTAAIQGQVVLDLDAIIAAI